MTLLKQNERKGAFYTGLKDGIPIALGYFAVSAAYGMAAIIQGMTVFEIVMISLSNLTSAGQFAGTGLIAAGASLVEIVLTQIMINSRYFLMSLSLNQKIPPKTPLYRKLIMAYGITDEIYAVAIGQKEVLPSYYYGLMLLPIIGWTSGTALGGLASHFLPPDLVNALGIAMYGMFIAIFVPAARKERPVMICVLLSVALSCLFAWTPVLSEFSSGYVIIIVTIIAAAFCAWKFPIQQKEESSKKQAVSKNASAPACDAVCESAGNSESAVKIESIENSKSCRKKNGKNRKDRKL